MTKVPIALQLFSVRDDCEKDLPATLKAVAAMGYDGVEFAGVYGYSAADLRRLLDDNGLKAAGAHVGYATLLGDELPKTVEFYRTIGAKYVVVPWIPEELRRSRDGWLQLAEIFNGIATRLKPEGMRTGYHNHHVEFSEMDGEIQWDIFFRNTVDEVAMQIDLGNAMHGGGDPLMFMRSYPNRLQTVHLKEYSATNDRAIIGEGDVDWADVFGICDRAGVTEWYVVEQESYAYPPLECVDRCLQALRKMGK